jgi:hypothetical protein
MARVDVFVYDMVFAASMLFLTCAYMTCGYAVLMHEVQRNFKKCVILEMLNCMYATCHGGAHTVLYCFPVNMDIYYVISPMRIFRNMNGTLMFGY